MPQIRAEIMRMHICDSQFEKRPSDFCDIIDDFCCIVHYIYDMVYKLRIIVFDQAGVFTGSDDLVAGFLFDLMHDPVCQIIRNNAARNDFSFMHTERSVLCYIGYLILHSGKKTAFVVVLTTACRNEMNTFLCDSAYNVYRVG